MVVFVFHCSFCRLIKLLADIGITRVSGKNKLSNRKQHGNAESDNAIITD